MKIIESLENSLVKKALNIKNPRNRDQHTRCLVEGLRAVETFLQSPYQLIRLYITKEHAEWAIRHTDNAHIVIVTPVIMNKISSATTPSGIIGMFEIPPAQSIDSLTDGIVLANIQDPGNMGTLIRTATALNKSVVIVDGVNPYNHKVIQASAGTLAQGKIFRTTWQMLVTQKKNYLLSALVVSHGKDLETICHDKKQRLLVVGNEASGLPECWQAQCDELLTLAMPGGTESLNAAVAGSIALYILKN